MFNKFFHSNNVSTLVPYIIQNYKVLWRIKVTAAILYRPKIGGKTNLTILDKSYRVKLSSKWDVYRVSNKVYRVNNNAI